MLGRHEVRDQVEHITTSYKVLVEAFGSPTPGDPYKVKAQWDINTPHGWAEIYDFHDPAEDPVDVAVWHVQAHEEEGFNYLYETIRDAASRLGEPSGLGEC